LFYTKGSFMTRPLSSPIAPARASIAHRTFVMPLTGPQTSQPGCPSQCVHQSRNNRLAFSQSTRSHSCPARQPRPNRDNGIDAAASASSSRAGGAKSGSSSRWKTTRPLLADLTNTPFLSRHLLGCHTIGLTTTGCHRCPLMIVSTTLSRSLLFWFF